MYHVRLTHECVALIHVNVRERLDTDVDRLHKRTCAHVVQESFPGARTYERRVRESIRARPAGIPQQRPGPELPARRVLMIHRRGSGGCIHLTVVRRRMGGDFVLGGEVIG